MIITIALGYLEQFFIMLVAVTVHELTHITFGIIFGLKPEKIIFTPLGQIAVIKDLDFIKLYQKIIIVLSGPFINFIIGFFVMLFFPYKFIYFRNINFAFGFFNLIPIYPFDGGRFLYFILSNNIGVIRSNKIVSYLSNIISCCLILFGFLQTILYPYNISLICLGMYSYYVNKNEYFIIMINFYRFVVLGHQKEINERLYPVKIINVSEDTPIKKLLSILNYDKFYIFYVISSKKIVKKITEMQLREYIREHGINGSVNIIETSKNL